LQSSNRRVCHAASAACARISFRSCPAEKPRPAAARTTTRASASAAVASTSLCRAAIIADESGLYRSPRFSVSRTTPADDSRTTSGGSGAGIGFVLMARAYRSPRRESLA
jgi:hypothetical protein